MRRNLVSWTYRSIEEVDERYVLQQASFGDRELDLLADLAEVFTQTIAGI